MPLGTVGGVGTGERETPSTRDLFCREGVGLKGLTVQLATQSRDSVCVEVTEPLAVCTPQAPPPSPGLLRVSVSPGGGAQASERIRSWPIQSVPPVLEAGAQRRLFCSVDMGR